MPEQENHNEQTGARRKFWEWQEWLDEETKRLKEKKGRVLDPTAPQTQAPVRTEHTPPPQGIKPADHYARVISSAFPDQILDVPAPTEEEPPTDSETVLNSVETPGAQETEEGVRESKFDKHLDELFSADRVIDIPGKRAFRHNTDHLEKKKIKRPLQKAGRLNFGPPLTLMGWLAELIVQQPK